VSKGLYTVKSLVGRFITLMLYKLLGWFEAGTKPAIPSTMNTIRVSNNIQDLTGFGEEALTDKDGNVIAKFFNGNFEKAIKHPADEMDRQTVVTKE
jgi:hypothetical protein